MELYSKRFDKYEALISRLAITLKQKGTLMKKRKSKAQTLVIDVALILGLAVAAIVFAVHGLNTKIPSFF
jgi:hypothetical protein